MGVGGGGVGGDEVFSACEYYGVKYGWLYSVSCAASTTELGSGLDEDRGL